MIPNGRGEGGYPHTLAILANRINCDIESITGKISYSRNSAGSPPLIAARTLAIRQSRSPKSAGSMGS